MLERLLVANRGEIAVRIIRAARDLGISTVAVHSDADADADAGALHVQIADAAVNIGPPAARKSYLNTEAILQAAAATGCDAIHPGYGFLAENAGFADAVAAAGMAFVGPSGDAIRLMGDKVAARSAAHAAGVPVVPGSMGRVADIGEARHLLMETGFPVMIKAAAGGGGRGIRIARNLTEFESGFPQAQPRRWRPLATAGSTWKRWSSAPATSRCRCWATAPTPSIASSGNVPCNAAARRSGKRRPRWR